MSRALGDSIMDACPHLCLRRDSFSVALYPTTDHVCGVDERRPPPLDWQARCCLTTEYCRCPRFQARRGVVPFEPIVATPYRPPKTTVAVFFLSIVILIWLASTVSITAVRSDRFVGVPAHDQHATQSAEVGSRHAARLAVN